MYEGLKGNDKGPIRESDRMLCHLYLLDPQVTELHLINLVHRVLIIRVGLGKGW